MKSKAELTYSRPCRPDTIEHVRSESDGHNKILWVADSHDVARLVLRKQIGAGVHAVDLFISVLLLRHRGNLHLTVRHFVLAAREAANRDTRRISPGHFFTTEFSHLEI